ncbi:MAG: hypothetical protein AAF694_04220 [Bacteroidota bacterium]
MDDQNKSVIEKPKDVQLAVSPAPEIYIDSYKIDIHQSQEFNLEAYLNTQSTDFWDLWYNKPLAYLPDLLERPDLSTMEEKDLYPKILEVGFWVISIPVYLVLVGIYIISFYPLTLLIGFIPWKLFRNYKQKKGYDIIWAFFRTTPVKFAQEIRRNENEIKRLSIIKNKGEENFTRFQQRIEKSLSAKITRDYSAKIDNTEQTYRDNLKYLQYLIEELQGNIDELHVSFALYEATKDFQRFGNVHSWDSSSERHERFMEELVIIQETRSIAEEIVAFDISEGIKERLEELETRRKKNSEEDKLE